MVDNIDVYVIPQNNNGIAFNVKANALLLWKSFIKLRNCAKRQQMNNDEDFALKNVKCGEP